MSEREMSQDVENTDLLLAILIHANKGYVKK